MPKIIDRTGERFGRLLVLSLAGKRGNDKQCLVRCDCGVEKVIVQSRLTQKVKAVRSCGCSKGLNHHTTHGLTGHKLFPIWRSMIARCNNPNHRSYHRYGGRGISVCKEWRDSPKDFLAWLGENGYKKGCQLDREDNNAGYSPDNCRIVTPRENSNNRRDNRKFQFDNDALTIAEIGRRVNLPYMKLYHLIVTRGKSVKHSMGALQNKLARGGK